MDRLEAAKYIKDHCLGSEVYRDGTTWNDAMVTAVEVLEGKDTNVHTNSASDHIHNVVRDDAYRRGYEQGKADANHPEIPDSWIPVSERLPETTDPVNITWVNHDPEVYYSNIKDKPFTATACFCNGKWWWYSAVCKDFLDEYGKCDMDQMDDAIEVTAWKPLPEPWKGETDGKTD